MFAKLINYIFFRKFRVSRRLSRFIERERSEWTEEILQALFQGMSLMFLLDSHYRRNIENFNARYLFKSKDARITVAAIFKDGKMTVRERAIDKTDITVVFRDYRTLLNFLLSPKQDILQSMLRQDVAYTGNLNYLSKFAYMAKHLQLKAEGKA